MLVFGSVLTLSSITMVQWKMGASPILFTPQKINMCPWRGTILTGNFIFQPLFLGDMLVFKGVPFKYPAFSTEPWIYKCKITISNRRYIFNLLFLEPVILVFVGVLFSTSRIRNAFRIEVVNADVIAEVGVNFTNGWLTVARKSEDRLICNMYIYI